VSFFVGVLFSVRGPLGPGSFRFGLCRSANVVLPRGLLISFFRAIRHFAQECATGFSDREMVVTPNSSTATLLSNDAVWLVRSYRVQKGTEV